ncbi:MAG: CopG family ribbon-helix-helix protein [Geminicoccaceae bacterium]
MSKTVTITGKVSERVKERLKAIADEKNRDEAEVVASFLEASIEAYDRKTEIIRARLADADAGGPFIDDDDMDLWLASWGADNELPEPKATIRT